MVAGVWVSGLYLCCIYNGWFACLLCWMFIGGWFGYLDVNSVVVLHVMVIIFALMYLLILLVLVGLLLCLLL